METRPEKEVQQGEVSQRTSVKERTETSLYQRQSETLTNVKMMTDRG